jgi:hypothetical protein
MSDETNDTTQPNETYEPPAVEDLDTSEGTTVTGAGAVTRTG